MAKKSVLEAAGQKVRRKNISKTAQNMTVSAIKEMAILAMKIPDVVSLSWGLPSFPTPEYICRRIIDDLKQYTKKLFLN